MKPIKTKYKKYIIIFLVPALLFFLAFLIYPFFANFYTSLFRIVSSPGQSTLVWVGVNNYKEILFKDFFIWKAAANTVIWAFASMALEIPLGFLLALILSTKLKGMQFFRNLWFAPVVLNEVMVAILWRWMYQPQWGAINTILRSIGISKLPMWLADPKLALFCLIMVTTWMWTGFNMVIFLASISSIPQDLIDATKIDGTNTFQRVRHLYMPLLRPATISLLILCFIGKMKVYGLVWVATFGGPLFSTETIATYIIRRAWYYHTTDMGYPSAIAAIFFVAVFIPVLVISIIMRKREVVEF